MPLPPHQAAALAVASLDATPRHILEAAIAAARQAKHDGFDLTFAIFFNSGADEKYASDLGYGYGPLEAVDLLFHPSLGRIVGTVDPVTFTPMPESSIRCRYCGQPSEDQSGTCLRCDPPAETQPVILHWAATEARPVTIYYCKAGAKTGQTVRVEQPGMPVFTGPGVHCYGVTGSMVHGNSTGKAKASGARCVFRITQGVVVQATPPDETAG